MHPSMKVLIFLSAQIGVALSITCYSPTIFTTQNQLLSKSTFSSQLECDKQCAGDPKCVAYSVNRLSDHVLCGFLGQEVDWTICAKPARVYKKVGCDVFPYNGYVASAQWTTNNGFDNVKLNVGQSAQDTPDFFMFGKNGNPLSFIVLNGCDVHILLTNKTILVHEVAKDPNNASATKTFTEDFTAFENAWGYCQ